MTETFADMVRRNMATPAPTTQRVERAPLLVPLTSRLRQVERMASNIAWEGGDPSRLDAEAKHIRERIAAGEDMEVLF